MIYPSFLTNGSTIGICAPSAGAGKDLESFDACLDTLKQQGYNINETQHVRVNDPRGGSAKQRGDELNQLFQDPEVTMERIKVTEINEATSVYLTSPAPLRHPPKII